MNQIKKFAQSALSSGIILALSASSAFAQNIELGPQGDFSQLPTEVSDVSRFVSVALQVLLVIAAVVFFVMLLVGGIRWILSGGDKANTQAARSQITAALVGLVIVFSAWIIAAIIGRVFRVDLFNIEIPQI